RRSFWQREQQLPVGDRIRTTRNLVTTGRNSPAGSLTPPCRTGTFSAFPQHRPGTDMARKTDDGPTGDKVAADLKVLRVQIDRLDLQIVEMLNKRAAVAGRIGKVKADQGGEVFSAA